MISFTVYIKQLCIFVLSSSLVLAVILGISLLIAGESSMSLNLDLDFGVYDGLGVILGLPLLSILIFVVLSPISFFIFRRLSKRGTKCVPSDA